MIAPRHLAWSGRVAARGLWLDVELLGQATARARVLSLWRPGCTLEQAGPGWLLRFRGLRSLQAPFPGVPLVPDEGVWLGVPLDRREREALGPPVGSVWIAHHGQLVRLEPTNPLDPGAWLDLGDLRPVQGELLGPQLDQARAAVDPTRLQKVDLSQFDNVGDGFAGRGLGLGAPGESERQAARPLPAWARWLARGLGWLSEQLGRLQPRPPMRPLDPRVPTPPRPPTWVDRLRSRLSRWMLSLMGRGPLRWMARHEAEWLQQLFDAFDRGDLEEALRRAIPLGRRASTELRRPGRLQKRDRLEPTARRGSGSSMLLSGAELHSTLERLYEDALRRLEAEGRITEAAFVLADLLERPHEAVHLLETHARLEEAAALAEGRELEPGLVVRLWVQAGELDRAVLLARRHDAWAAALTALKEHAPDAALAVRAAWARTRAAAGDPVGAFAVAWEAPELREQARPWLRAALDDAGPTGARALAAAWTHHAEPELLPRAAALLRQPGLAGLTRRTALARALLAERDFARTAPTPERLRQDRRLASRLARALLADPPSTSADFHRGLVDRLLGLSGDRALAADRPRDTVPPSGACRDHWPADDRGQHAISDVAWLPDGRLLVACGQAGLRLLDERGREVGRLPVPAHALVISDDGGRALALESLDEHTWAVRRIDLRHGRVHPWARVRLHGAARTFDGERWCVIMDGELLQIDALDPGWQHLWRVQPDGALLSLSRQEGSLRGLVDTRGPDSDGDVEIWRWDLPAVTLRARPLARIAGERPSRVWFAGAEAVASAADGVHVVGISPATWAPRPICRTASAARGCPWAGSRAAAACSLAPDPPEPTRTPCAPPWSTAPAMR